MKTMTSRGSVGPICDYCSSDSLEFLRFEGNSDFLKEFMVFFSIFLVTKVSGSENSQQKSQQQQKEAASP